MPRGGTREILPAFAAMLVAVPAAIANGLVMFAPLGPSATAAGALAGLIGAAVLGLVAPPLGGTPGLVSAPSPAAAAFLAAFAGDLLAHGVAAERIPIRFVVAAIVAGLLQVAIGTLRGGRLVKFLPYPVVAGYLTGAGLLILHSQLPRLLGAPPGTAPLAALAGPRVWNPLSISVVAVTLAVALLAPRVTKRVPATLVGIAAGALFYRAAAMGHPDLLRLTGNPLLVGTLPGSGHLSALGGGVGTLWRCQADDVRAALVSGLALGVLISIDTLKTCLLVDATVRGRHDSDRELLGQGIANVASALAGGAPGTGIVSGTMVNLGGGGRHRLSGFLAGLFALGALLLFAPLIAYLPVPALSAIVALMAVRMFQRNALQLVWERRTFVDFAVVAVVVATALGGNLAVAAATGLVLSVALYVRDQARAPLVGRTILGTGGATTRRRSEAERKALEANEGEVAWVELVGSLFFGTADRLQTELEPHLGRRTLAVDLGRLRSVDLSGVAALGSVAAAMAERGGRLVLCDLPGGETGQRLDAYLLRLGMRGPNAGVRIAPTVAEALASAEEELLRRHLPGADGRGEGPLGVDELELIAALPTEALAALRPHLRERVAQAGERLFTRGEPARELYFVRAGTVRVSAPLSDGRSHPVATYGRGELFGAIGFVDGRPRSADAVAESETLLYALSRDALREAARVVPGIETLLDARLALMLAGRLRHADHELRALRTA